MTEDHQHDLPPLESYGVDEPKSQKADKKPSIIRAPLDWDCLADREPPIREWAVHGWLPMQHSTLLAGSGGIGKTTLAQALGTCLTQGHDYVDLIAKPRRVLLWAGEDDHDELWRRQIVICRNLGVSFADLKGRLFIESFVDRDMTLASNAYGGLMRTPMLDELRDQVGDYGIDYVFLDNIARVYAGSEIERHPVTLFTTWLNAACKPTGAGVCLLGHPGKAMGAEYSGSTAWENAVRCRLYMGTRLPGQPGAGSDDDDPLDERVRFLCRRKANYTTKDFRKLIFADDGFLKPEEVVQEPFGKVPGSEMARDIVLRAVRRLKDISHYGNSSTRSPDYLPRLAKQYQFLEDLTDPQFARAMRELIVEKRLVSVTVGTYGNRTPKLGLAESGQ